MESIKQKLRFLYAVFWVLIAIFILLVSSFIIISEILEQMFQMFFPFIAILAFIFFFLGIVLIILTVKAEVKGKLKGYLILIGASAIGILAGAVLHNFYYALAMITGSSLAEIYHVTFFLIAIPICPICFLVGAIGSIMLFKKKRKR